jgi:hypothetical protein
LFSIVTIQAYKIPAPFVTTYLCEYKERNKLKWEKEKHVTLENVAQN